MKSRFDILPILALALLLPSLAIASDDDVSDGFPFGIGGTGTGTGTGTSSGGYSGNSSRGTDPGTGGYVVGSVVIPAGGPRMNPGGILPMPDRPYSGFPYSADLYGSGGAGNQGSTNNNTQPQGNPDRASTLPPKCEEGTLVPGSVVESTRFCALPLGEETAVSSSGNGCQGRAYISTSFSCELNGQILKNVNNGEVSVTKANVVDEVSCDLVQCVDVKPIERQMLDAVVKTTMKEKSILSRFSTWKANIITSIGKLFIRTEDMVELYKEDTRDPMNKKILGEPKCSGGERPHVLNVDRRSCRAGGNILNILIVKNITASELRATLGTEQLADLYHTYFGDPRRIAALQASAGSNEELQKHLHDFDSSQNDHLLKDLESPTFRIKGKDLMEIGEMLLGLTPGKTWNVRTYQCINSAGQVYEEGVAKDIEAQLTNSSNFDTSEPCDPVPTGEFNYDWYHSEPPQTEIAKVIRA